MAKYLITLGLPILVILLSIPMVMGVVPPNRYYGLRVGKTYASPELWYAGNRIGGTYILVGGIIALVLAQILVHKDASSGLTLVAVLAPILIAVFASLLHVQAL
ncbi:MAG TPA: SdpI family protein [Pyrinomonadaceae bacterium]|nr:SdpI family protein [Pyrinomonadaceae bacterium]